MILCADVADLAAGLLACPSCGSGRLRRRGFARKRETRVPCGRRMLLAPRRGRCEACGATHALLLSRCAPRRADGAETIAAGLILAAGGAGSGRIGAEPGIPAATARGPPRRLRPRAEELRQDATFRPGFPGADDCTLPAPAGSPPGDAPAAVAACSYAAITRHGRGREDLPALPSFIRPRPVPGTRARPTAGSRAGRRRASRPPAALIMTTAAPRDERHAATAVTASRDRARNDGFCTPALNVAFAFIPGGRAQPPPAAGENGCPAPQPPAGDGTAGLSRAAAPGYTRQLTAAALRAARAARAGAARDGFAPALDAGG